jgi:hypothetical protein
VVNIASGDRYVPEPRKMSSYKPEVDPALSDVPSDVVML